MVTVANDSRVRPQSEMLIKVRGQKLQVVVDHGNDPEIPPLLLMNGIGARLELLQPFVDAMDPARTIIRFDPPGIGRSRKPHKMYRIRGLTKRLAQVLDELGFDQVDVLGISWGGGLAQQFAVSQRGRCRRLVLVSTSTGSLMIPPDPRVIAKIVTYRRYTDADYMTAIAHQVYGGSMRKDPAKAVDALRAHGPGAASFGYFMQLTTTAMWTSLHKLPFISQRTLVLAGDDDPIIPSGNAKVLGSLIRRSTVQIYEGGHLALVTEADEMAPRVETFLNAE